MLIVLDVTCKSCGGFQLAAYEFANEDDMQAGIEKLTKMCAVCGERLTLNQVLHGVSAANEEEGVEQ